MPWCSSCDRYLAPNAATTAGTCPTCGTDLDRAELAVDDRPADASASVPDDVAPESDNEPEKIPWHFWLLVIALVLYLGWRVIQGVAWFF